MKTTGTGFASRALLALFASITLSTTSRAAPPSTAPVFSLGIETQVLSDGWRMREGYRAGGVLVTAVTPGSVAARAGLEPGDILVSLGSRVLHNPLDLRAAESTVAPGHPVSAVVARDAGRMIRIFNIGAEPETEVAVTPATPRPATTEFGMRCDNLGRERATELGAPEDCGVLVRHVNSGSTAEAADIAAGDVVTFAAGRPVANVDELETIIADAASPLAIVTVRDGTTRHLTAEFVTPTPPAPSATQLAGTVPASAGHGSETAVLDAAASPAGDSGTPPAAVDATASPARDSATPGPATAAGAPPAPTATDALVAALRDEVLSLREEVRKLREEIAKLAR